MENKSGQNTPTYVKKVWIAISIAALVACTLMLFKQGISVFLLILAGVLIAAFFRGFAGLIQKYTKWKTSISLILAVLITLSLFAGVFTLIGARVYQESLKLVEEMPKFMETATKYIEQNDFMRDLLDRASESNLEEKAAPILNSFFQSSFGVIGDVYIMLFLGIVFTISPKVYQQGLVRLTPAKGREKALELTDKIGATLKNWLKGMLVSMAFVTVFSAIGLAVLGIPMWLILALIAGMLSFIPNFGPIISLVPAALVALTISPLMALVTIALYCLIQLLESAIVTPLVQQKLINTPPALMIVFQVFMGVWTGGWGIILAVPVLVIVMILVDELYVKAQDKRDRALEQD